MKRFSEGRKCSAFGCFVSEKSHPHIKLFHFPKGKKNFERYQQWVDFSENFTLGRENPTRAFLCAHHFTLDQFEDDTETNLINDALPTVPAIRITPPTASPTLLLSKHKIPYSLTEVDYEPMCAVSFDCANAELNDHSYSTPPGPAVVVVPLTSCLQTEPLLNTPGGTDLVGKQGGEDDNRVPIIQQYHVVGAPSGSSAILSKVRTSTGLQKKRILTIYSKKKFIDIKKERNELTEEELEKLNDGSLKSLKPLSEFLPLSSLVFLASQLRCSKRKPQGRRWLAEEKQMALSMYKDSPKSYALLRAIFSLPHKRTLVNMKHLKNNRTISLFRKAPVNNVGEV